MVSGPLSREDCPQAWRGNLRRLGGWDAEDHEIKRLPGQAVVVSGPLSHEMSPQACNLSRLDVEDHEMKLLPGQALKQKVVWGPPSYEEGPQPWRGNLGHLQMFQFLIRLELGVVVVNDQALVFGG